MVTKTIMDGLSDNPQPRKRRRMEKPQDRVNYPPFFRDPVYFFDDADSWIIVQDTLFKIHYSLLSGDNSIFSDMFSLPTGDPLTHASPRISEEEPLRLYDEVDDFRALCYALYTPLHEFCRLGGSGTVSLADLTFLITLLKTANKYNFQSLQDCVINQLVLHCCPKQGTDLTKWISPLDRMPLPELERLLHLAVVINHIELCKAVQNSWLMQRRQLNTPTP